MQVAVFTGKLDMAFNNQMSKSILQIFSNLSF